MNVPVGAISSVDGDIAEVFRQFRMSRNDGGDGGQKSGDVMCKRRRSTVWIR
jgi:hypothetical protein